MSKNAEGWIRHRGGKCPVEAGTLVDVRYRSGIVNEHVKSLESVNSGGSVGLSAVTWEHYGSIHDIMAYRLHKPAEQVEACSKPELQINLPDNYGEIIGGSIEGPLQWRDRIEEIDADIKFEEDRYNANMACMNQERAELVQKLASEGFALIGREPDAPIGLPREEWEIGDLVVLPKKTAKTSMPTGIPLPITFFDGSSDGQDVKVDDFYYPPVCDLVWHSRPSA